MNYQPIAIADVEFEIEATQDDLRIEGNAGSEESEKWINEQLDAGNVWAWASVHITGRFEGLEADDYLGACSYESEEAFKQAGGYYDDMRQQIVDDLNAQLEKLADKLHGLAR